MKSITISISENCVQLAMASNADALKSSFSFLLSDPDYSEKCLILDCSSVETKFLDLVILELKKIIEDEFEIDVAGIIRPIDLFT